MAENGIREALDELLDYLEQVETQSGAVLQYLKDNGATDDKLAPYLERAGNATGVKSRAIRARFDFLFSTDDNPSSVDAVPQQSESAADQGSERAA